MSLQLGAASILCSCALWRCIYYYKSCSEQQCRCVTMNSSDLWILCDRHLELCAFLHLSLGATIPLHTSSIDHFTWMNWVQVQSRRLSDVVWRLFLNGATRCSLPCCLSVTRSAFYWAALLPLWEGKCFSWVLHGSYKDVTRCQNKPGQKSGTGRGK